MRDFAISVTLLFSVLVAGCKAKIPEGIFACTKGKSCPSGQLCHADGFCYAHRQGASDAGDGHERDANVDGDTTGPGTGGTGSEVIGTGGKNAGVGENGDGTGGESGNGEANGAGGQNGTDGGENGTAGTNGTGSASGTGGAGGDAGTDAGGQLPGCGASPDESAGIFVSPAGSAMMQCGSADMPCLTIGQGIARAQSAHRALVYMDGGNYAESVTLAPGLTLQGGWTDIGNKWTRLCNADRAAAAVIASPTNTGVLAEYAGSATLDTLTVNTKATAAAGETPYGVFARGPTTQLTLNDVIVNAAAGGDGATGAMSTTPAAATGTCPADDGAIGSPDGSIGSGALAGSFSTNGYTPTDGSQGETATALGHNGTVGADPPYVDCTDGSCGRGASMTCNGNVTGSLYAGRGASGCGGAPSAGSQGGHGGGSSVALFVWDATVTTSQGALSSGDGGKGGAGGASAPGGPGSSGTTGASPTACMFCSEVCVHGGPCACRNQNLDQATFDSLFPGTTGGDGGAGSKGGPGGGGAGGFSYAVYKNANANVSTADTTMLTHGSAGTSLSNGAAGDAARIAP